jgi:hypothetical protein
VKFGRLMTIFAIIAAAALGWMVGVSVSTPASASNGFASTAAVAKAQATANAALAAAKRAETTANAASASAQSGGTHQSAQIVFVSPRACASPATADGQFTVAVSNNGAPFNTTLYNCLEKVVVP